VDASTWAGDPKNPDFIAGQMRLLDMNLQEAKAALKGGTDLQIPWYKNELDETVCSLFLAALYLLILTL